MTALKRLLPLTVLGGTSLALAIYQTAPSGPGLPAQQIAHRHGHTLNAPAEYTLEEETLATTALLNGDPLPEGWSIAEMHEEVTVSTTGLINQTSGEKQVVVTIRDDSIDIEYVKLYLDGDLLFTATRSNGAIVDRNNIALASITAWLPAQTPYALLMEWATSSGDVRTQSTYLSQ